MRVGVLRGFGESDWPREVDIAAAAADLGADVVDPVFLALDAGWQDAERELLLHEFKACLNRYLGEHETEIADLARSTPSPYQPTGRRRESAPGWRVQQALPPSRPSAVVQAWRCHGRSSTACRSALH